MELKKCKKCGEEISSLSNTCPKCRKKQENVIKFAILGAIVLFLIVAIFLNPDSNNDNNTVSTISNSLETTSNINTNPNNINTNSNNTNKITKGTANVGESYKDKDIMISYLSTNLDFKDYSKDADIKEGYKVISAEFEFKNIGSYDFLISAYDFSCYADGSDCEFFLNVADSNFSSELPVDKKTKKTVYFQVPTDAETIVFEYNLNLWVNSKVEFIVQ